MHKGPTEDMFAMATIDLDDIFDQVLEGSRIQIYNKTKWQKINEIKYSIWPLQISFTLLDLCKGMYGKYVINTWLMSIQKLEWVT